MEQHLIFYIFFFFCKFLISLQKSKAACKQALAPSFLERLADQPDEEMKVSFCYGIPGFSLHWLTSDSSEKPVTRN